MKGLRNSLGFTIIICMFLLSACSTQSNKSSNGSKEENDTSFVFKTTIQTPPVATLSKAFDAYLDAIEEKSEGRIKFERYYSESLVKTPDVLDALSAGIADVGILIPPLVESKIPLNQIVHTSGVYENSWPGGKAINDLYEQFPELNEELEKNGVTFAGQFGIPSNYIFTKDPVKSIGDIKGKKLVATGDQGLIAQELGAVPVSITSTEAFEALQKGAVDGVIFNLTTATTYNYEQVAKHLYKLPIGGVGLLIGMNTDKYLSLPEDLQQIIKEVSKTHVDDFHQIYQSAGDKVAFEKIEKAGGTITEPTAEDVKKLKNMISNLLWKDWVDTHGKSSQKMLDTFIELSDKYEKENPYKEE
ncbi:C4-dicarboxylate TRAP transporter substrate-binding protein [Neobacillus niacini]|uniref:C4-dicarboxylate TRAP transporter substrate-binding protein n=1 Tax=Neobacillus niacini TaxID=86668 RepID=UPI003000037A